MSTQRGLGRREQIRLRSTERERHAFTEAANLSGLSLSGWLRMVARAAAIKALTEAQKADVLQGLIGR